MICKYKIPFIRTASPILVLLILVSSTIGSLAGHVPKFGDFPAGIVYRGQTRLPDFGRRDRWAKDYRTRIKYGLQSGPNFAGHFSAIEIGCGGSCGFMYIANNKNGEVIKSNLLIGGEKYYNISYKYQVDSNLILASYEKTLDDGSEYSYKTIACIIEGFLLKEKSIIRIYTGKFPSNYDKNGNVVGDCSDYM